MSRFVKFFVCAFAMVAIAGVAQAATVDLQLTTWQAGGLWSLTATASQGDNDGIAGYNINLVGGVDEAFSLGPKAVSSVTFSGFGFTVDNKAFTGDGPVFAGQNSTVPASLLYHVGQQAWADDEPFLPGSENALDSTGTPIAGMPTIPYDNPVEIARGTGDWLGINFDVSANVNVWDAGMAAQGGTDASAADVNVNVTRIPIPEPASLALLGIAMLGVVGLRRKLG